METEVKELRPKPDSSLGWAYRPDKDTTAALSRGRSKLKKTYFNLGADKPHMGGSGSLAEALDEAKKAEDKRRGLGQRKRRKGRRRRMARMVSKKRTSSKKTAAVSKKRTAVKASAEESTGKLIPLKKICEEMDLDPKATRVKLRRMIDKGEIDWHDPNSRWEFSPKRAKEVRSLLSAD